jgi:hypothetical protein
MTDFFQYTLKQVEETAKSKTKKEQSEMIITAMARILEVCITKNYKLARQN